MTRRAKRSIGVAILITMWIAPFVYDYCEYGGRRAFINIGISAAVGFGAILFLILLGWLFTSDKS